jgi:hypothetical protein
VRHQFAAGLTVHGGNILFEQGIDAERGILGHGGNCSTES